MTDYKNTLNLPKTSFPMRAKLPKNEPGIIDFWEKNNAYAQMTQSNAPDKSFVLHDGPPYANGHIHLGTAMNKILKDIIVKSRNLMGYRAEYVPGWDCHGLPIELKVEQEMESRKKSLSTLEIRKNCREYALKYLDIQRNEFKRLGVLGQWDSPYLTMHPAYEAATAGELCAFMEKGSVLRSKKPIHWCPSCETALAEAEVEYADKTSPSIYVRFPIKDPKITELVPETENHQVFLVIWTTTPWTVPNNLAVALHPDFDYVLVEVEGQIYLLAEKLWKECAETFQWSEPTVVATLPGRDLEGIQGEHPLYSRPSPIVLADYVTLESGTGCVHTAPGHGQEDYETGLKYGLDIYAPLDDQGRYLSSVEFFSGKNVFAANPLIIEKLREFGALLAEEKLSHSYPHCWRCKQPVIFRATTQWFISMDKNGLRDKALQAIEEQVRWIPAWGRQRIGNMIANRPDWCISRQRSWGVPIIALICQDCGQAYFESEWVKTIVDRFAGHENGADYWFEAPLQEIVPPGLACSHCRGTNWQKETDILDVWFDSGTSYAAVLEQRRECSYPADMYLEGSDQHRGWFHSSLLASTGTRGRAPYRTVLTHGFVVDGQGKKMSKSIGNVVAPQDIIDKYGAEILRMWVASENYQEDLRISDTILKQLVDNYRRIRNTCRYLLGNINDFDPAAQAVSEEDMLPLDRYVLDMIRQKHEAIASHYENYDLHKVFHTLHNLCVNELSAFYLDILKDRLYVSAANSLERRSAQTALNRILLMLIKDMSPILSFTAEEVFQNLPEDIRGGAQTILAFDPPPLSRTVISSQEKELWDFLLQVRSEVTRAIEPFRKQGTIGHSLDVLLTLSGDRETMDRLAMVQDYLRDFFIVSQLELAPAGTDLEDGYQSDEIPGLQIKISRAKGEKCSRCWTFSPDLGRDPDHPEICPRCSRELGVQF
ncbi:MAG: isoleucine--tRNA ligase [Desulfohalobiaceae bacterium]|nr:isoleucine--tRNA ligase [Desulfohalobiaceae bacterium]